MDRFLLRDDQWERIVNLLPRRRGYPEKRGKRIIDYSSKRSSGLPVLVRHGVIFLYPMGDGIMFVNDFFVG